jgi:hypothetical protein
MKKRGKSKGFSVFTPMVGTLIITITILIVASIIQSEKIANLGAFQGYETLRMSNIAREVEGRLKEKIRSTFNDKTERLDFHSNLCLKYDLFGEYGWDISKNCSGIVLKNATEGLESGLAITAELGTTQLQNIQQQYNLKIQETGVNLEDVIEEIKFKDCQWIDTCSDGRIEVRVNYTEAANNPLARIYANETSMDVYLEPGVKTFTSNDPFGVYALRIGKLFQNFTLMDRNWHGAGNASGSVKPWDRLPEQGAIKDASNQVSGHGDGSQWYHYEYVIQYRKPVHTGSLNYLTTGTSNFASKNFAYSKNKEPVVLSEIVENSISSYHGNADAILNEYEIKNTFSNGLNGLSGVDVMSNAMEKYFYCGYVNTYRIGYPNQIGNKQVFKQALDETGTRWGGIDPANPPGPDPFNILIGGVVEETTGIFEDGNFLINPLTGQPRQPGFPVEISNDLFIDDDPITGRDPDVTAVNTTIEYDKKFASGLENALKGVGTLPGIKNMVLSGNPAVIDAMGFDSSNIPATNQKLQYALNVTSWQIYSMDNGQMEGGDNWYCGQSSGKYMPDLQGSYCQDIATNLYIITNPSQADNCPFFHPWFYTFPINHSCRTYSMVAVVEDYELNRTTALTTTPSNPDEINKTVFKVRFKRFKTDYQDGPRNDDRLWSDSRQAELSVQDLEDIANGVPGAPDIAVRKCTYYANTVSPGVQKNCKWVAYRPTP